METILNLRNAAENNILQYCKNNNCENEYKLFRNEIIRKADEFNTSLPVDFYIKFYNLSLNLLNNKEL